MSNRPTAATNRRALYGACALAGVLATANAGCLRDLYFGDDAKDEPDVTDPHCSQQADGPLEPMPADGPAFPLDLGQTVRAAVPPPPITGGTLAMSPDQALLVASDTARDQVYIVAVATQTLVATVDMRPGDHPGRVAVDSNDTAYVALRRGGSIAAIDLTQGALVARYDVCPAPRGVDFDDVTGLVWVACHSGELMTVNPAGGVVTEVVRLDSGLRDVVATAGEHIYVTDFRRAHVTVLDRAGTVLDRMTPPGLDTMEVSVEGKDQETHFEPAVAWRAVEHPEGGIALLHQRGRDNIVSVARGGYGGDPCGSGGVVHGAITRIQYGQQPRATQAIPVAVLPVDMALVENNTHAVVVAAGNGMTEIDFEIGPAVFRTPVDQEHRPFECSFPEGFPSRGFQPVSVAAAATGAVFVQSREPAALLIYPEGATFAEPIVLPLSSETRDDTGLRMFHTNSGAFVACASCHPEGGDDHRVWEFDCIGPRRTQSMTFGVKGTEPLHWDGDMDSFDTLMSEVFVGRMGGGQPTTEQVTVMGDWLDTVQAPPRAIPRDLSAVERGGALFRDATVACATCHSGAKLTNNQSYDVGTGGTFQVPNLIDIASRAPFIHTGCAPTLRERFTNTACGGGDKHGVTSHLTGQQIDDLVAYLHTL